MFLFAVRNLPSIDCKTDDFCVKKDLLDLLDLFDFLSEIMSDTWYAYI